jgi:DNA uptake protein ComE-like DNA-binding protein
VRLHTYLRSLIMAALLAAGLAACGATPASEPAPTSAAAEPAAPAPTDTAAPEAPTAEIPTATAATDASTATPAAAAQPTAAPAATEPAQAAPARLNLNEVTADQLLASIPDFSQRMVREFFEYRPYISILQFRREIGKYVDEDQVAIYEQYVYVPIDVDQADAATLQQLPGVDAAIADQLIAGRPYGSNQAFLEKLAGLVPAADTTQAATLLAGS